MVPNLSHFVAPENYIMIIAQLRDIFSDPVIKSVMVSIAIGQENYRKTPVNWYVGTVGVIKFSSVRRHNFHVAPWPQESAPWPQVGNPCSWRNPRFLSINVIIKRGLWIWKWKWIFFLLTLSCPYTYTVEFRWLKGSSCKQKFLCYIFI